jgi:KTSC domain
MTILRQDFIQSSMLSSAEYDTETKELSVTFSNGRRYVYVDVPVETYRALIEAPSAGRYFNSIKAQLKLYVTA